jgi:hypothetical protein
MARNPRPEAAGAGVGGNEGRGANVFGVHNIC